MNFIDDKELALRFKNDAVPSSERLIYLLIFMMFSAALSSSWVINFLANPLANTFDYLFDTFYILISVAGTLICYLTNKNGDDSEFIERYISIGFPITIKWTLIFTILVMATLSFFDFVLGYEFPPESGPIDIIFGVLFLTSYFLRLNSSIKIASH